MLLLRWTTSPLTGATVGVPGRQHVDAHVGAAAGAGGAPRVGEVTGPLTGQNMAPMARRRALAASTAACASAISRASWAALMAAVISFTLVANAIASSGFSGRGLPGRQRLLHLGHEARLLAQCRPDRPRWPRRRPAPPRRRPGPPAAAPRARRGRPRRLEGPEVDGRLVGLHVEDGLLDGGILGGLGGQDVEGGRCRRVDELVDHQGVGLVGRTGDAELHVAERLVGVGQRLVGGGDRRAEPSRLSWRSTSAALAERGGHGADAQAVDRHHGELAGDRSSPASSCPARPSGARSGQQAEQREGDGRMAHRLASSIDPEP